MVKLFCIYTIETLKDPDTFFKHVIQYGKSVLTSVLMLQKQQEKL